MNLEKNTKGYIGGFVKRKKGRMIQIYCKHKNKKIFFKKIVKYMEGLNYKELKITIYQSICAFSQST